MKYATNYPHREKLQGWIFQIRRWTASIHCSLHNGDAWRQTRHAQPPLHFMSGEYERNWLDHQHLGWKTYKLQQNSARGIVCHRLLIPRKMQLLGSISLRSEKVSYTDIRSRIFPEQWKFYRISPKDQPTNQLSQATTDRSPSCQSFRRSMKRWSWRCWFIILKRISCCQNTIQTFGKDILPSPHVSK